MNQRPLGDLVDFIGGGTPSRSVPSFWGAGLPWVTVKDFKGKYIEGAQESITSEGLENSASNLVPAGTILIPTRMALGKAAITLVDVTINQDVKALLIRSKEEIDRDYLFHWLTSQAEKIQSLGQGATVKGITLDKLRALAMPLPPPSEQRRIANILEKADAIRSKRKEAIAFTEELLRSAFLEMFGDPVTNPKGWKVEPLGESAEIIGGGTPSRACPEYFIGKIPWATAKDFKADLMFDTEEHVSPEAVHASATQVVQPGAVLVVVKSKILMRRLPVAVAQVPLCFNQDVKAIVPHEGGESSYIAAHLRMAQRSMLELARGVNTEGLTVDHLRSHPVMRPPPSLVTKFVTFEARLRESLQHEKKALSEAEELFASLVHRAFRGGLPTPGTADKTVDSGDCNGEAHDHHS